MAAHLLAGSIEPKAEAHAVRNCTQALIAFTALTDPRTQERIPRLWEQLTSTLNGFTLYLNEHLHTVDDGDPLPPPPPQGHYCWVVIIDNADALREAASAALEAAERRDLDALAPHAAYLAEHVADANFLIAEPHHTHIRWDDDSSSWTSA